MTCIALFSIFFADVFHILFFGGSLERGLKMLLASHKVGIALAAALIAGSWSAAHSAAQARERWVKVINRSDRTIERLYVSYSRNSDWGSDVLEDGVITSDHEEIVTIYPGSCLVDLKAVMEDGSHTETYQANVCGGFDWTIYDD